MKERTEKEVDEAIEAGELVLYHDGRKVRLGRAVNSKTTIGQGESEAMKKIKVVETMGVSKRRVKGSQRGKKAAAKLRQLEAENRRLQMENDFLKKLRELERGR